MTFALSLKIKELLRERTHAKNIVASKQPVTLEISREGLVIWK